MFPMRSVLLFIVLTSCGCNYSVSEYIQPSDELESEKLKSSNNILEPGEICLTKTCNDTALEILKNMDDTADFCNDFHQFACGGYSKSTIIPDHSNKLRIINFENKIFINQLEKSLKEPIKHNEPRPIKMVKNYFQSCVNESAIEKNSVESLIQIIKSFGGWPLIEGDKWDGTNFDWIECITKFQKMGYLINNMPFVFTKKNVNNVTKRVIHVMRDPSSILFRHGADNKTIDILREDLINITVELGADRKFAEKEVLELFSFILELYDLDKDENYSEHKFENFWAINGSFNASSLKKYIEKMILPFSNIDDETDVVWMNSNYDVISLMNRTSKRVQANYIIWCFVSRSILSLKNDIRVKSEKLLKDGGFESFIGNSSRTEVCMEITSHTMTISLLALYIRNNFDRNLKNDTIRISENIGKQILKNLEGETSLSNLIKDIIRREMEKVKTSIAYDGNFFNDSELEELDKNLNISSPDDHLHNGLNLMRFLTIGQLNHLQGPIDDTQNLWDSINDKKSWQESDAFLVKRSILMSRSISEDIFNTLMTSAASLQSTMNNIENPEYIKYGTTGSILGHELYWGMDRLRHIEDPNFEGIPWNDASDKFFSRRDECLMDQYDNYLLVDRKVIWRPSFRKNIADIGGIKAAYLAYSDWASNRKPELMLYNLSYTPKQMFWISAMNNFCAQEKYSTSFDRIEIQTPFINMPEFAKDFNCPVGSKMNPSRRCSLI